MKDFSIFSHKMQTLSFIETSFIYSLLERIFTYVFVYLRILTQVVYTSYLWSKISDSPIHKFKYIYTLQ